MSTTTQEQPRRIVDAFGQPARAVTDDVCPRCGAGPDKRVPSSGFGAPHPVCPCGYEFHGEVFRG